MERNYLISNIRIIATFIVVLGHSIMLYSNNWGLIPINHSTPPNLLTISKKTIDLFQMPLFFSLSGYLHQYLINKGKIITLKSLLTKKFLRLFVPYIFLSIIMLYIRLYVNYCNWQELSNLEILNNLLFMRNDSHLWFLSALFQIFILHYFISHIKRNNIELILALCISLTSSYLPIGYLFHTGDALKYLFWFYLGCWIKNNQTQIQFSYNKSKSAIILLFLLSLTLSFLLRQGRTTHIIIQYMSSILFIFIIYNTVSTKKCYKGMEILDKNSFAIYLFHIPIIYLIFYHNNNINPYIISFLCIVVSYIASITLGNIIRKSKLKILIGE